jgi:hypothetical protein
MNKYDNIYSIGVAMADNVTDLNDIRRLRNMEKGIAKYEKQLADLKKAHKVLEPHIDFRFFSITCHALREEQRTIAGELLRLKLRMDKIKYPDKYLLPETTISNDPENKDTK